MIGFLLSDRDRMRLDGVHPDLVAVVEAAAKRYDGKFMVVEGLRTPERQRELVAKGPARRRTVCTSNRPTAGAVPSTWRRWWAGQSPGAIGRHFEAWPTP